MTSAEVQKKLENLTAKKTKLRGINRTANSDYSHVKRMIIRTYAKGRIIRYL